MWRQTTWQGRRYGKHHLQCRFNICKTLVHKNGSHTQMPGDSAQDASCSGRLDGMQMHWMQILEHCIVRSASTSSSTCCRRLFSALSPFWTGFWKIGNSRHLLQKESFGKMSPQWVLNYYWQVSAERDRQRQPQETSVGGGRLYAHCGQVCQIIRKSRDSCVNSKLRVLRSGTNILCWGMRRSMHQKSRTLFTSQVCCAFLLLSTDLVILLVANWTWRFGL